MVVVALGFYTGLTEPQETNAMLDENLGLHLRGGGRGVSVCEEGLHVPRKSVWWPLQRSHQDS